jgi:hypothetical protein
MRTCKQRGAERERGRVSDDDDFALAIAPSSLLEKCVRLRSVSCRFDACLMIAEEEERKKKRTGDDCEFIFQSISICNDVRGGEMRER